jgi:hypothetical protein
MTMRKEGDRSPDALQQKEYELGVYTLGLFRAWHELEKGIEIIDFDLIDQDFPVINTASRKDIQSGLQSIIEKSTGNTPTQEFLQAKALGSLTYLQALEGEKLPFSDYCEKTVGITPEMVSGQRLDQQKQKTDEALSKLGYDTTAEGYNSYFTENQLEAEDIRKQFNDAKEKSNTLIVNTLGLQKLLPLQYDESFVEEDAYWICWVRGQRGGMDLRINLHPRNKIRWVKGTPERVASHEMGGHIVQALSWKENIKNGIINPGFGITSIPGQEQWACEGMADALPALIPELYDGFSDEAKFMYELKILSNMVRNNTHIMSNDEPNPLAIIEYTKRFLPFETDERIEKGVTDATRSPYLRSYLMTYNDAMPYFNDLGRRLKERCTPLLKELYKRPMTPAQVKAIAANL